MDGWMDIHECVFEVLAPMETAFSASDSVSQCVGGLTLEVEREPTGVVLSRKASLF